MNTSWRRVCPSSFQYLFVFLFPLGMCQGCAPKTGAPPQPETPVVGEVTAAPLDLFPGDLKVLEPHLGITAGGVRIDLGERKLHPTLNMEIWQAGKKIGFQKSTDMEQTGHVNASISMTEVMGPNGKPQYRITTALYGQSGGTGGTRLYDQIEGGGVGYTRRDKKLNKPIELSDGKPVAVWAYLMFKDVNPSPPRIVTEGTIEEAAKGVDWALLLKVGWQRDWNAPDDP